MGGGAPVGLEGGPAPTPPHATTTTAPTITLEGGPATARAEGGAPGGVEDAPVEGAAPLPSEGEPTATTTARLESSGAPGWVGAREEARAPERPSSPGGRSTSSFDTASEVRAGQRGVKGSWFSLRTLKL